MPHNELQTALDLAALGYPVFPCNSDKSPLTTNGLKDATTDAAQIETWFSRWPFALVAMRCDGVCVIDRDAGSTWPGPERAAELASVPTARTRGGGWHHVYRMPSGKDWRPSVCKLAEKVDTRCGPGSYIIVWGWIEGCELDRSPAELPEPPAWLVAELEHVDRKPMAAAKSDGNVIPDGQRNAALTSLAGGMRRQGMSETEILAALRQANADRCRPPLDDSEITTIATSVARYEPDQLTVARIERHAEQDAASAGPVIVSLADVTPMPVEWLWPGRIAIGKLTLIAGDPGLGKSFLTLDLAARKSAGKPWPDSPRVANPPGAVVLLSAEDDLADTIRPRLDAAGADVSRIAALQGINVGSDQVRTFNFESDLAHLETTIAKTPGCQLVIVDPVSAYLGDTDSHKNAAIRGLLTPLKELAERTRVGIVAVTHLNKGASGPAMYRATGSLAFIAAARAGWLVAKDKEDARRRLFLPVKNNLAEDVAGLAFSIVDGKVEWESAPVIVTADDALAFEQPTADTPGDRQTVADWLSELLAAGEMPQRDIADAASGHGYTMGQVRRAKQRLGVEARRAGGLGGKGHWVWFVPGAAIMPAAKVASDATKDDASTVTGNIAA